MDEDLPAGWTRGDVGVIPVERDTTDCIFMTLQENVYIMQMSV